jgi:hypothetical protein
MNEIIITILGLLDEITENPEKRLDNVREFQKLIWDATEPLIESKALWEELCDLAYDLDYYEPNEEIRQSDSSLYDENRVKEEVLPVLKSLRESVESQNEGVGPE